MFPVYVVGIWQFVSRIVYVLPDPFANSPPSIELLFHINRPHSLARPPNTTTARRRCLLGRLRVATLSSLFSLDRRSRTQPKKDSSTSECGCGDCADRRRSDAPQRPDETPSLSSVSPSSSVPQRRCHSIRLFVSLTHIQPLQRATHGATRLVCSGYPLRRRPTKTPMPRVLMHWHRR